MQMEKEKFLIKEKTKKKEKEKKRSSHSYKDFTLVWILIRTFMKDMIAIPNSSPVWNFFAFSKAAV